MHNVGIKIYKLHTSYGTFFINTYNFALNSFFIWIAILCVPVPWKNRYKMFFLFFRQLRLLYKKALNSWCTNRKIRTVSIYWQEKTRSTNAKIEKDKLIIRQTFKLVNASQSTSLSAGLKNQWGLMVSNFRVVPVNLENYKDFKSKWFVVK